MVRGRKRERKKIELRNRERESERREKEARKKTGENERNLNQYSMYKSLTQNTRQIVTLYALAVLTKKELATIKLERY